jgi:arylsulfatase A-like enzyme/tetratricopeptide (TPR) repeat protein
LAAAALIGAALIAAIAVAFRGRSAQADLRVVRDQNVLLLTIDTLRADALGSYGGHVSTPALDKLAAEGVRFDFAHAHAVLTLPSHASILTGEYPFRHGLRENSGYRLGAGARTLATLLKQEGYATAAFVSAFPVHSRFGLNQGFDVYDDRFGETRAPTEFVMPERPAAVSVPLARKWIAERPDSKPWFVWLHVFDPHAPYRPPAPFDAQYADRPYDGEVAATDAALAPLLDDVRAASRGTLVVVTGDHGEALGDHGEQTHGIFAYESTLRVPLIVAEIGGGVRLKADTTGRAATGVASGFGGISTGEVSSVPARHVDILPTILDAIGRPVPGDVPGRALLPAAERRGGAPRASYFEAMAAMLNRGWAPLTGVVADRDKFIDVPIAERYDLATDPGESVNLAGRTPDRDRTLAGVLRGFGASLPGERRAEDPEALARLRALGYVSGSAPVKARYTEADDAKRLIELDQAVHRGVSFYSQHRYQDAIDEYRGILSRRADMAIAYRHLAFVYWETGDVRAALDTLRRALAAGVTTEGITTQFGNYLAESGSSAEAIRLLEPEAKRPAPDIDALNALGIAYARGGRADDARRVFERIVSIDPQNAIAFENLGALDLARDKLADAAAHFERAAHIDPNSSQAHAGLGVVAKKRGENAGAIDEWKKAVALDATNYDALYNLAITLAQQGAMADARPYLEQFVRTAPPAFYADDLREISAVLQKQR